MSRRNTISREFFSTIAVVLVLGLSVMCAIQTALSAAYFVQERRTALNDILNGASKLCETFAEDGSVLTRPLDNEQAKENARNGFDLFTTSSGAVLFVADENGDILLHTGSEDFTEQPIPADMLAEMDAGDNIFKTGTLGGVYSGKYYTAGRRVEVGGYTGYLFAASPMTALASYMGDMLAMFGISAAVILLLCSLLCWVLAKRITGPIEDISEAARLQTIDNSRGQFMGNIAHELRTPMTTIKGFIDGMLDGTIPPEENQRYLAIVSQETGRLARLVQNMLDITKLEAGEVPIHAKNYDLWQTVTDVVLSDEQRIEDGKIDIQGLGGPPLMICADPDFVHQVVYNIVDNAIKFTPAGGVISFAAEKHGSMVEVRIENTGAGIAPEALPFVFERFYKEDRSRGMNTRGSGLGLHICKILINLSGGQIHAESEEGKWCRFVFTLPCGQ